jgi:hypothetical protein
MCCPKEAARCSNLAGLRCCTDEEDDEEDLAPWTPPATPAMPRPDPWDSSSSLCVGKDDDEELVPRTPLTVALGLESDVA